MSNFKTFGPYPFDGPVSRKENRAAHGNICFRDERSDGAIRFRNVNGRHQEIGSWKGGVR
jgi:hypothetical protein